MNWTKKILSVVFLVMVIAVGGFLWSRHDPTLKQAAPQEKKIIYYRNPMDPSVTSHVPTKDNMGMSYIPVYEEAQATQSDVKGRAGFSLTEARQQLIGVKSTKVTMKSLAYEIRASGRVAFDPELYTAIEEYTQARLSSSQIDNSILKEQAKATIASAKVKLELMGLTSQQISRLSSGRTDPMSLILPKGSAWIYAEVFEYEVGGLTKDASISVEAPSIPGSSFMGKVSSISPVVNSPTRTVRVRALVPDPQSVLRPDTYVNVKIKVDLGSKLAVPEESVLFSGEQAFVYLLASDGRFEPKAIRVGAKTETDYEVVQGLKDGDRVVTSANFLIDSESRLRGIVPKEMKK
jgi:Cu(I)/Ag(I) efflux system membrane fusion protein